MSSTEINLPRFVRFEEDRLLTADALDEASRARDARRHLHNRWCHGYGIVKGLELACEDRKLLILKGLAFDAEGRELMFCRDYCGKLALKDGQSRELWLRANPENANDDPEVLLLPAGHIARDRPWINGLNAVFLGTVTGSKLEVNRSGVVLAYASAARVTSPTGAAQIRLGPESSEDPRRFAIFVRRNRDLEEAFRIDTDGRAHLFMDAEVRDDETAAGKAEPLAHNAILLGDSDNAEEHGAMLAFQKGDAPPPDAPKPWSIYAAKDKEKKLEDLRIEIFNPGKEGSPQLQQFTLCVDDDKLFVVDADNQVTVKGLLDVVGAFVSHAGKPDPAQPPSAPPEIGGHLGIQATKKRENDDAGVKSTEFEIVVSSLTGIPIADLVVDVAIVAQLMSGRQVARSDRQPVRTLSVLPVLVASHTWKETFRFQGDVTRYLLTISARGALADGNVVRSESTFTL